MPTTVNIGGLHGELGTSKGGFLPSLLCKLGPTENEEDASVIRLVYDTGATHTFVTRSTCVRTGLVEEDPISQKVHGIGGRISQLLVSNVVCYLFALTSHFSCRISCRAIDRICGTLPPLGVDWGDFPAVDMLRVTEELPREAGEVEVLVGNDHMAELLLSITAAGEGRKYLLWDTRLGLALSGRAGETESKLKTTSSLAQQLEVTNDQLLGELKRFWNWETLGAVEHQKLLSPSETYVVEHYYKNVKFVGNRYQVSLPFDPDSPKPKNNYASALAQFKSLERSLIRNESKCARYAAAMQQYIKDGHAELVFSAAPDKDERYFLPHHAVWRDNHPSTKARIVFNGSAPDETGFSLNNSMLPGPALQTDLCDILTRFRTFPYILVGDISKMFLQIGIEPAERNYLCFFWRKPGSKDPVQIFRKTVLPFGLNCAPYIAIQTVTHHLDLHEKEFPSAVSLLRHQLFVDDCLIGGDSREKLIETRKEVTDLMERAGFHFTKWLANDSQVQLSIPEEDRALAAPMVIAEKDMALSPDAISKTLGIQFNPLSDNFEFRGALDLAAPIERETMRTLASRAARVFDPLGFASPFIIQAKMHMQSCWRLGLSWDDPLPPEVLLPWLAWIRELPALHLLELPRTIYIKQPVAIQLHGFSDASQYACSACVYARSEDATGKVLTRLIASKTKLAPLQTCSIPRLELTGALLLALLMHKVSTALQQTDVVLWTDNTTCLQWLSKCPSSLKTFVANRVSQITELYPPKLWRFVPSTENIADIASRGMGAAQLVNCADWFEGPAFLSEREYCWPKSPIPTAVSADGLLEIKPAEPLCLFVESREQTFVKGFFENVHPFWRNLRQLAFVIRFCFNARPRHRAERILSARPTVFELRNALKIWAQFVQELAFPAELKTLRNDLPLTKGVLGQLQPYFDFTSGLAKVGGRLALSGLPEEEMNPVILPAKNRYVESYVLAMHQCMFHLGAEGLLAHIRMKFWLLQGRREVKRILRKCKCFRLRAPHFVQSIAPLPSGRVTASHAWIELGVDYAGPFEVLREPLQLTAKVKKEAKEKAVFAKVWVLLATCLSTRAVHFEYMTAMDTSHFLNALQRLIARRGHCSVIYSDNAKQFLKSERELQKLYKNLDWTKIEKFCLKLPTQIVWKFSAPLAPHYGGFWERLVGSMKRALKSTLAGRRATLEEFRTVLCNAEAVTNSRPLTLVSDDIRDPLPITPAHLTIGRAILQLPDSLTKDNWNDTVAVLWKDRQRLHSEYWNRWRKEYIKELQVAHKWTHPDQEPRVDEVVLVDDSPVPRDQWPIARIKEVYPGRDGKARSVLLWFGNNIPERRRDVRRLCRLEERASNVEVERVDSDSN